MNRHRARLVRAAGAIAACLGSAAVSVWMRLDAVNPFPTFVGACERLRASSLPVTSRDWFCQPSPWTARAAFAGSLLLIGIALVVPSAILASTGRRWSALLPLAIAPWLGAPSFYGTPWWTAGAAGHALADVSGNVAVLVLPVLAISVVMQRRPAARPPAGLLPGIAVGLGCSLASFGMVIVARSLMERHWQAVGGLDTPGLVPASIGIALFGLLLGPERRWWPWAFAPVAFLLSGAPSVALLAGPERWTDWSRFGLVAPLTAIGLVWSAWGPASTWLAARMGRIAPPARRRPSVEPEVLPPADRAHPRVRPIVALDAVAVVIVVVSLIAFRADPFLDRLDTALPTFLGVRVHATDVRTKLDLRQAITAMDAYAKVNGSYRGFDAAAGRRLDPTLEWSDGHRSGTASGAIAALTMSIEPAPSGGARVAALSESGNGFCLQRSNRGTLTFGTWPGSGGQATTIERAIADCGSSSWGPAATRMPDVPHLCDGLDPSGGYMICRMVQVLVTGTMERTKPA